MAPCKFVFGVLFVLACIAASIIPASSIVTDTSTTTDLLWPLPSRYGFDAGYFTINPSSFKFIAAAAGVNSTTLQAAFERYTRLIFDTPVPFYSNNNDDVFIGELGALYVELLTSDETLGPDTNETCELVYKL